MSARSRYYLSFPIIILLFLLVLHARPLPTEAGPAGSYRHYLALVQRGNKGSPLPTPVATPPPTVTATIPPTPEATPQPPVSSWLDYLNARRAIGGLPPVAENMAWSHGNELHGRYMVKNDVIGHSEEPGNAWYTADGDAAARTANVIVSSSTQATYENAIDGWLTGPFHGVGLLDPQLLQSGYGEYREADGGWQFGAGLDVLRGLGAVPPSVSFPIRFPKANGTTDVRFYGGGESPNPLTSCPGYTAPTGAPLYLMVGAGELSPTVTASSLTKGGVSLVHCLYDENTYTNPDSNQQSLARSILGIRDAIVIIPRAPLEIGATYTVSITVDGEVETWSFTVTPRAELPRAPMVTQ